MPTCFEDLSNEILIIILEYLASPIAIYRSFGRLNHRFDYLLQFIRLNLDIFTEDQQTFQLTHYFSAYCNRLRIDTVCPSISLKEFSRLRSLIIIEPTDEQMNSIQCQNLPMLEYLACPARRSIFDCLFANEDQQWRYLRRCHFYFSHVPYSKSTWQINSHLQTLLGITCSRIVLSQLLSRLPCLEHLRVDMLANDSSNWNLLIFEKTLRSLRIGFHRLNNEDLCALMNSDLSRLYVDIYDERSTIDFTYLGALLNFFRKNFKQFNCDYRGMEIPLENIRQSHPFFENLELIKSHSRDLIRLQCRSLLFN